MGSPAKKQLLTDEEFQRLLELSDDDDDESELTLLHKAPEEKPKMKSRKRRRHERPTYFSSGAPWKSGDIVWVINWYSATTGRVLKEIVNESDFVPGMHDFQAIKKEIRGYLYIVKEADITRKGVNHCVVLNPVFDNYCFTPDWSYNNLPVVCSNWTHVHPYKANYCVNRAIMDVIFESVTSNANSKEESDYLKVRTAIKAQYENVQNFTSLQWKNPQLETKYLLMNKDERRMYLRSFDIPPMNMQFTETVESEDQVASTENSPKLSSQWCDDEEDQKEEDMKPEENGKFSEKEASPLEEEPSQKNLELLEWFKRPDVVLKLKRIVRGKEPSKRHDMQLGIDYKQSEGSAQGYHMKKMILANEAFIDNDRQKTNIKILNIVSDLVYTQSKRFLKTKEKNCSVFRNRYVIQCLIPEGIILYLMDKYQCSKDDAENMFVPKLL